jgi:Skp family chaperone for outer membrane proteins
MKFAVPTLMSRLNETRRVECDGFYDGAHGTPVETGIEEIEGKFEEKKANLQKDAVTRQKSLEAEIQHLDEVGPQAEHAYRSAEEKNTDQIPTMVVPSCMIAIALLALTAEALMLAPAMDILNVTEQISQLISAFGLAGISALAFHFVWESFTSQAFPKIWKMTLRVVAVMLTFGLVVWGILRGYQVAFAASLNQNPLGDFLLGHPILSSIFFVFITLATPVIAATATHYGAHRIQNWWEWKTTKTKFETLSKRRAAAIKELEAQEKALQLGTKALDEERKQWKSVYSLHHERGGKHGAKQEPYWIVIAKASFAALFALLAAGWFIFFISPFFVLFPIVVWWAAFLYYRRQWRTPSRVEFFDLEHVQFVVPTKDAHVADARVGTFSRQNNQRGTE